MIAIMTTFDNDYKNDLTIQYSILDGIRKRVKFKMNLAQKKY
jgi:hypothetical protein